jgi:small subunit ribosomal protein S25e
MGGKKKLGIKKMEKQQEGQDEGKQDKKKEKAGAPREKKASSIIAPDAKNDKVIAEVKKMGVLTPYSVATKYNIRISTAKYFLAQLQTNGAIQLVSGSHNIKIYKPAAT